VKKVLDFFNIHPDANQRWTLSVLFVCGIMYTYVSPAMTKAIITALPAEWIAFQSLFSSICGLFVGMVWKGSLRKKVIKWFSTLCIIESAAGFLVGMYLCFVSYNAWLFAIATLVYSSLVSMFVGKCIMAFRPKLWNDKERELYDNNNSIVCGIYCIIGFLFSLLFMPSLNTALFVWGSVCALDNIGWIVIYQRNRKLLNEE